MFFLYDSQRYQLILDKEFGADEVQEKIEESFDIEEGLNGISEEDLIEAGFDPDGHKIESVSKQMMDDLEPIPQTVPSEPKPFLTATNMPTTEHDESDDLEAAKEVPQPTSLTDGDSITAELQDPDSITAGIDTVRTSLGTVKMIQETPEEEEYAEITIPSVSDLERLTKAQIKEAADKINFNVSKNQSKVKMIDSFTEQTEKFIEDLKESGDFVSASDTGEEDDDTTVRDGGFF